MNIKENFHSKLQQIREDYDKSWADETKHTKNILSGARRKDDKKKWKGFVKDANKRAVTGMSGKHEGEKRVDEEQLDEVNKKSAIGKFLRHREAVKKGWGTFGKAIFAKTDDETRKHVRNANRYDSLTKTGKASTKPLDEQQLDELHGKGTVDKKEMQAHIRKKHDAAWKKTQDIRKEKKSAGPADTRDMDEYRGRLARMHNKLDK